MESRWYIRIYYCPLLFLRGASRNRWHHTEIAVSCVITWLPPNHRNSNQHRMSFVFQPLRKICCTFTAAYVRGPGFVLVADLASEIQMIRPFHYRGDGLSLPCKRHFIANVTKLSALLTQLRGITNARLALLGSLCGIYDAGVNGCAVHDGLMQYDAIF